MRKRNLATALVAAGLALLGPLTVPQLTSMAAASGHRQATQLAPAATRCTSRDLYVFATSDPRTATARPGARA